jgi:hypothetical protein
MVARSHETAPDSPAENREVDHAGWDPYIVGLTAAERREAPAATGPGEPDTRKGQLMAWLRAHGADA